MPSRWPFCRVLAVLLVPLLLVIGCAPWQPAPVEERRPAPQHTESRPSVPPPPFYEVRRGDTLYSIAFRYGLDWREVASWNDIDEPYLIRPGRELRLSEPPRTADARAPSRPPEDPPRRSRPAEPAPQPEVRPPRPASPDRAGNGRRVGGVDWHWPTEGRVVRPFDPAATRRGIGIGGQAGQAVVAAADGEVVYSGTALIGYGNLIIIKHSATMLSAYGHNQRRLVDEGDRVSAGQTIAEMGRNERDEDILHFEIRRNGQAEDPLQFLPAR